MRCTGSWPAASAVPLVTQFSSFLYSMGGDWFDADRKATINTPEALAAIDLYGTLLREYGPPGVLNMSWPQAVAIFAQGNAAMYTDASSIYANLLDPENFDRGRQDWRGRLPGRTGRLDHVQCDELGPGHVLRFQEQGSGL